MAEDGGVWYIRGGNYDLWLPAGAGAFSVHDHDGAGVKDTSARFIQVVLK